MEPPYLITRDAVALPVAGHYDPGDPRIWVACEEPERPPDSWISWHLSIRGDGCRGCQIKAAVRIASGIPPDDARRLAAMVGLEDHG